MPAQNKVLIAATLMCLVAMPAHAGCPTKSADNWHLLTKSLGGTISLIKNLTKHECEFARARALGLPASKEEEQAWNTAHPGGLSFTGIPVEGGNYIVRAECFE